FGGPLGDDRVAGEIERRVTDHRRPTEAIRGEGPLRFDASDRDEAELLQALDPSLDAGLVDRTGTVEASDEFRVDHPGPHREQGNGPRTDEPEAGKPVRGEDDGPATEAAVPVEAPETDQRIEPADLPAET